MDITLQNLFRQPPFVMLWLSQTLQSLGTVLLQVIVMVNVYRHTDSVFSSSLVLAVMALGLLQAESWAPVTSTAFRRFKC